MGHPAPRRATVADLLPLIERGEPVELVDGELVRKAAPDPAHGGSQAKLGEALGPFNRKPGGPRGPGGWWIMTEVDTRDPRTGEVFRHDAQGCRRELWPERPTGVPVDAVPPWVCEILSPSTVKLDRGRKLAVYARERVPHVWFVDPAERHLEVLQIDGATYRAILSVTGAVTVRAAPFAAIELALASLWLR